MLVGGRFGGCFGVGWRVLWCWLVGAFGGCWWALLVLVDGCFGGGWWALGGGCLVVVVGWRALVLVWSALWWVLLLVGLTVAWCLSVGAFWALWSRLEVC